MAKNRSAVRAGLLMLGSLVLIGCVVVGIKGLTWLSDPKKSYLVAFDLRTNIEGLQIGDPVRIGGYKVGEVDKIFVREDKDPKRPPYYILVRFSVPERYSIRQDADLRIGSSVTGTAWLNFESLGRKDPLPADAPLIGRGSALTEFVAGVQQLQPRIDSILKQVDETLPMVTGAVADVRGTTIPKVNNVLDDGRKTMTAFTATADKATDVLADAQKNYLPKLLEDYRRVMVAANKALAGIDAFFGDTSSNFQATIANLKKTTDPIAAKSDKMVDDFAKTLDNVRVATESAKAAIAELQPTLATTNKVITGNRSKLEDMIDSLKKAGDNLKNATAEVRRSPWRLLYKPAPNEMANLNLYDSARQFAEGANDLQDAAAALRDAAASGKVTDDQLKEMMDKLDESFKKYRDVENKLWGDVKE